MLALRNLWSHHRLFVTGRWALLALPALTCGAASAQFSRPALMPRDAAQETTAVVPPSATPRPLPVASSGLMAPVLSVDQIARFADGVGWREVARLPARAFDHGMIEALELERTKSLRPGVELYPRTVVALLSFAEAARIPLARPGSPQRYHPDAAKQGFAELASSAADWTPVHYDAVRIADQVMVFLTAGFLFQPATSELAGFCAGIGARGGSSPHARSLRARGARAAESYRVKEAQRLLGLMGFYDSSLDGIWGPRSRAAMEAFQVVSGLPASGEPDSASIAALRSEADRYGGL